MKNTLSEIITGLLDLEVLNKASDLTEQLRDAAAKAGWPTFVVMQLEIVVNEGEYDVYYPREAKETIEVLEYGTETTPPNPVLRNFIKSIGQRVTA